MCEKYLETEQGFDTASRPILVDKIGHIDHVHAPDTADAVAQFPI